MALPAQQPVVSSLTATCRVSGESSDTAPNSLAPSLVCQLPSRLSASAAAAEDEDTVLLEQSDHADSADTAGGGMPRKLPQQFAGALIGTLPVVAHDVGGPGHGRNEAMLCEVPRIIWSSSDSSEDSSLEDEEITSDASSSDSLPVLGLALGLGRHGPALKSHVT